MENTFVSVVILSMKPPKRLLQDLDNQRYPYFEIIIAREKGPVNAMNKALEKAKGDIFVRIDDDVKLPPEWLLNLVAPFDDPMVAGVTGPTFVPEDRMMNRDSIKYARNPGLFLRWLYDNDPYAPAKIYKCGNVSYGSNFVDKLEHRDHYAIDHLEGTNWAMRTDLIRKVGGFDTKFDGVGEWFDTDVEFKIKKLGYELYYNRYAIVWHILEKGEHYSERFEGIGRIKNWLRFHIRHSKFHWKMIVFLFTWGIYFLLKNVQRKGER